MTDKIQIKRDGRFFDTPEVGEMYEKLLQIKPENVQLESTNYTWDESGMAELFADLYNKSTRYCPERKSWYTYDSGVWKKDTEGLLVSDKVREFVRVLMLYATGIDDETKRNDYAAWVIKMGDRRFRDRLIKDARDNLKISATDFDNNPYLINCKNGTYDLQTLSFREARYDDFLTMQTSFEFTIRNYKTLKCPRWEQFIKEVCSGEADKISFLQRALGYSMIGKSNEECMFILYGKTTRNGKSTLLDAINYLLGDYSSVSPVSIICKADTHKNAEAASPTIASLKGKRFVTMAESNQYGKLDEETIKQLTGGEEILARNLYESPTTFLPQFSLWLSCNDLPAVNDKSLFASDRLKVIEFNKHFSAEERDTSLKDLFKTKEAQQGMFAWLIRGYVAYCEQGLAMSDSLKKVISQYEKDNDLILQFVEEKCEKDTGGEPLKTLYEQYKIWCKSNGYFVCNNKKFCAGLLQHPEYVERKSTVHGVTFIYGIKIK